MKNLDLNLYCDFFYIPSHSCEMATVSLIMES